MVWYGTSIAHLMIVTCWGLGWLKWRQTTQMMMWWRSCEDPDGHWWRSCDDPSDNLKMTLTTQKMIGDYVVMILLSNWWRPLKIWCWQLTTFDDHNCRLSLLKSKVACLAGFVITHSILNINIKNMPKKVSTKLASKNMNLELGENLEGSSWHNSISEETPSLNPNKSSIFKITMFKKFIWKGNAFQNFGV